MVYGWAYYYYKVNGSQSAPKYITLAKNLTGLRAHLYFVEIYDIYMCDHLINFFAILIDS